MSKSKEAAGRRAAAFVQSGMTVGLGTGSTVHFTLLELAARCQREALVLRGVPTSLDTQRKARELGLALASLAEVDSIDVTIDGADEVDPAFHLIKGGGGALLREKVVASITRREVIVVGRDKLSPRLGTSFRLPVEVVPFARPMVQRELARLGFDALPRSARDGAAYHTDNGNEILDCRIPGGIADPPNLERRLKSIPGIVEVGLFCNLAHALVIGDEDGSVEVRERR
jgi:ribose 5-phosphate isomerase A